MNFQYNLPVQLIFGRGKIETLGTVVSTYGKRVLLVTGKGSTRKSGLLDRAITLLTAKDMDVVLYDQVSQNPLTTTAIAGAELAKQRQCDVVLGIGGGSIMDCAKAIAFLAINKGDINDYIFKNVISDKALPIVLVPTTCGTGSEGNGFAVLTNPETGDKKSLRCNAIVAKASIVDSTLMETMPKSVLASVGFDALCHNMEAFLSITAQPLTDMMCKEGIRLVKESLVPLYQGECTPENWDKLTLASTLGGMVIHTAGVTVAHGLEHPASGLKDLVHGKGLAALTPVVMEKTIPFATEKCAIISQLLGGNNAEDCVEQIRLLLTKLDLSITLGEQGITEEDVPWMTENFFKVSIAGHQHHPIIFTKEDIKEIINKSI